MVLTEAQEIEILKTMHSYGSAYQNKDIKALLGIFSPMISGFGSGPDEIILDRQTFEKQIRRDLSQATIVSFEFSGTKIFGEGRIAWVTSKSTIVFSVNGAKKQAMKGRTTMVLRNTGSRWVIEQVHFSMPYGGQSEGQSFPGA